MQPPTPTISKRDIEGLALGLAKIKNSPELDLSLSPEEEVIFKKAQGQGFLALPYNEAREKLHLLILWEIWCLTEKIPTLWVLERGPGDHMVCINVHTTGRTMGLKGWTKLRKAAEMMGLEQEKRMILGIRVYKGSPPEYWKDTLTKVVEANLWGKDKDRLKYVLSWDAWGQIWKER